MKAIESLNFVEISELGIKVSEEVVGKMKYTEAEKYCKENNARMLNVLEAGHIFDNDLIKDFCKTEEWLEHYSKKTRKTGFGCYALNGAWTFGDWLSICGYEWYDNDTLHTFGVRLVYEYR